MGRQRSLLVLALLSLGVALACASPAGIRKVDAREVHRTLTSNVLTTGEPSVPSRQVLQRMGLRELFERDPAAAIQEIHASELRPGRVFALAELSFWLGEQTRDRARYLAAAVYAWAYLFPGAEGDRPLATDPRYRLACDLYNRGLTEGIDLPALEDVRWAGGQIALPFGVLDITFDRAELEWSGWELGRFLPAAYLEVRGLRNRYRYPGVGAPLVASLVAPVGGERAAQLRAHIAPQLKVPATALLRIRDARERLTSGSLSARLELITQDERRSVAIEGEEVPLEFETSSALAYSIEGPPIWLRELSDFFYGGVVPRLTAVPEDVIGFLQPYRPGRMPVVLVHGTASSVVRWADLVNELLSDPLVWDRYQIWLYRYDSGNPVGYSAGVFRQALGATVRALDPEGDDPALRQMVVIGHSQGGLLAKLTAVDSGDRFWRNLSRKTFAEMNLESEEREVLERSMFFTPLPFVKRVVFIATPHRGSYLTLERLGRWVAGFVEVPNGLSQLTYDFVARNRDDLLLRQLDRPVTAIDNMTPGNPFLKTLLKLNVAQGVAAHSIIAVEGDGPEEDGADGVVRYRSAHLKNVESTVVVRSSHSCQGNPATIEEVRRILREHAAANAAPIAGAQ
jgi:pimeloyl-ACP methyl ester carboxylesterase